ncbi:MAG TPA: hypothetical protein VJH65_00835 [Candidatus Nanoarchaeia archaeon]|nr:hypothetical protein [Candidatus Nanoarchaeia archaeon]
MNFQFYLEKLTTSEQFKKFKKENPDAYLCSCFFAVDLEGKDNKQHFDYFIPHLNKAFSFKLEDDFAKVEIENFNSKANKLSNRLNFDFNEIEELIVKRIDQEKIKNKIQKILFSLQNIEGKHFLIGTIFLSGLAMVKIQIALEEKKIKEFEKKSFFDIIKKY